MRKNEVKYVLRTLSDYIEAIQLEFPEVEWIDILDCKSFPQIPSGKALIFIQVPTEYSLSPLEGLHKKVQEFLNSQKGTPVEITVLLRPLSLTFNLLREILEKLYPEGKVNEKK